MTPTTVSRVNYFDGEALLRSDFDAEQAYHKGARERLSAGLFRAGVVSGMDVTWSAQTPTQVTVTEGMALDCRGREIVLLADQAVTLDALTDGKQNFLTVSYGELLAVGSNAPTMEFKRIEEAPFFNCTPDYDPTGSEVLLAVIEAQGGNVQAVRYQYGNYSRRHVGAALGAVEFVLESDTAPPGIEHGGNVPQRMAISAQQDDLTGERYLDISAPEIRFDGNVQAAGEFSGQFDGAVSGHATLDGAFTGTFTGNGSGLVGVKATGYWQQNSDGTLFYAAGNVGINDSQPTALLTVGQPVNSHIGRGLMTAYKIEQGIVTVEGYQTNFTRDIEGKILQFGVVLKQQATIASVDGDDSLTLDESFPLGLGPTTYRYILASAGQTTEMPGAGMITPDGKTVTASGGAQFKSQLKLNTGDVLVIDRFVPQQQVITSKVSGAPLNDTSLTLTQAFSEDVTNSAYLYSTEPDRWITGQGTISSVGTQVTGVGTTFTQLPAGATLRAMAALDIASVPQTWRIDSVIDSKHLTMHKISIEDGSPLLPASSAFMMTTWELMRVGGELQPATPPALTVVQNNGTVPNTVAINVDDSTVPIDSHYALQVNGPTKFEGGALTVDGELDVDGNLHVTGWAKVDANVTAGGDLDVIGNAALGGKLDVKGDSTLEGTLDVKGDSTLEGTLEVKGASATLDGTLDVKGDSTLGGELEVKGASTTLDGTLDVKGASTTLDGTLEVKGASTTLDGTLDVKGASTTLDGTLDVKGDSTLEGKLDVKGDTTLEGGLEVKGQNATFDHDVVVDGDLTVLGNLNTKQKPGSIFGTQVTVYDQAVKTTQDQGGPVYLCEYNAKTDGFIILTTDNKNSTLTSGNNWFFYTFELAVTAGGSSVTNYYSTAFEQSYSFTVSPYHDQAARGAAFISVPISEGSAIVVNYYQGGLIDTAFNVKVYFTPMAA